MSKSEKVLRKGGNPNNSQDWENCSGDPTCPRHVHLQKTVKSTPDAFNAVIKLEVEQEVDIFIKAHPPTLGEKNRNENAVTAATIFSMLTVALASGGGAIYIADAFAGGPIPFELAFGLGTMFGVMGGAFGGMAAYMTNRRATKNNKANRIADMYEEETGTKLSKEERKIFKNKVSLEITDEDHAQNQKNMMLAQEEANRKYLEQYNAPSKKL